MADGSTPALSTRDLTTGYDGREIVRSVSIDIYSGQIVAVLGRNGSGKSTFLKGLVGLLPIWSGSILVDGKPVKSVTPRSMLQQGIGLVLQGGRVFLDMTVADNLLLAARAGEPRATIQDVTARASRLFPELKVSMMRQASTLSGGEKQVLALASALVRRPKILLLDEPSLGLSPQGMASMFEKISALNEKFDTTILIVEQKVRKALAVAHAAYVLQGGEVVFEGHPAELLDDDAFTKALI